MRSNADIYYYIINKFMVELTGPSDQKKLPFIANNSNNLIYRQNVVNMVDSYDAKMCAEIGKSSQIAPGF